MINKYEFFGGGVVYMIDLYLLRIGIKLGKLYMIQFRGFKAINLEKK